MSKFKFNPSTGKLDRIEYAFIQDQDKDTKIWTNKGRTDDDTIRVDLGGATPITDALTINQTNGFVWNNGQDNLPVAFHSEDTRNLVYIKTATGDDGVGFGTSNTQFSTTSGSRRSRSLYIKPDANNYNNIAIGVYTNDALRSTDFGSIRARGTEDTPLILQSNDWLHQYTVYGYDGTGFHPTAGFRYEVTGSAVSASTIPSLVKFQTTDSAGTFATRFTINEDLIGIGDQNPNSGLEVNHSLSFKVQNSVPGGYTTDHDNILGVVTDSAKTVTLQTADRVIGRIMTIKDRSGNASTYPITIDTQGSEKIDGRDTYIINEDYGSVMLYCGGSNWFVMNEILNPAKLRVTDVTTATKTLNQAMWFVGVSYTSTGAVTITLPSAANAYNSTNGEGHSFIIADTGANASVNNITINPAGSDTIITDITGDTSATINGDGDVLRIVAINSTTWKVF